MNAREPVLAGEAPLVVRLLRIALPLTMAGAVRYAVELSTIYWTGRLGMSAIAVVSSVAYFLSFTRMFAGLASAGTSAVLARLVGEERAIEARAVGQRVTTLAPLLGAAVAVACSLVVGSVLRASGLPEAVHRDAAAYVLVLLAGLPFAYGLVALNATFVGLGHARSSFVVNVVSLAIAFALTPLLVVVARLGLAGAAFAQIAGDAVAVVFGIFRLRAIVGAGEWLPLSRRVRGLRSLLPVLKVGAPLTLDAVLHATIGFALVAYIARYGTEYVAAQGTEERLTQILNLPTEGLAPATATLVGFYVGRGERRRARRVIATSLGLIALFALAGAALLLTAPRPIVAFLCNDASYVGASVRILAVAALSLVFLGVRDLMDSSFGGIGNTLPPLVVGTVVTASRFPLAWWLSRSLGLGGLGVTWAINGTLAVQGVLLLVWLFVRFDAYAARATEDDAVVEVA